VSGGTGDILYAITPNLNQFDTVNTFTDLAPGDYDVIAQDENGCFIPFQFTINEPLPIEVSTVNVLPEICVGSEDGAIEIAISGGTSPYRTSLNSNEDANFVVDQFLFNDLAAGTYVIFVKDANDCENNIIVEIDPGVNLNAEVTPIYECIGNLPNNRIEVVLEDDSVANEVLYALDSENPADMGLSPNFSDLTPGDHYVMIAHTNGCVNRVDFTIEGFEPLMLVLEQNNVNEITAIATGGLEDYTFYFDGNNNGTDNTYFINRTDNYTVTVIDQNGCEISAEIFMEFIDIEIPNFFTPDGNGTNDLWMPENLEAFPDVLILIFDRYGRELHRMGSEDQGWNGIYNNTPLPTGDYWYVIKLKAENDDREFVGHFTLYR
ncbi:MAG: T9SS type B sorting domain-containing protein, partial [Croceivirga sp.]